MVLGLEAGEGAEGVRHRAAMAGGVVALVAQQRNGSAQFFCQLFKQVALLAEVPAEVPEEFRVVPVIAQLVADGLG